MPVEELCIELHIVPACDLHSLIVGCQTRLPAGWRSREGRDYFNSQAPLSAGLNVRRGGWWRVPAARLFFERARRFIRCTQTFWTARLVAARIFWSWCSVTIGGYEKGSAWWLYMASVPPPQAGGLAWLAF